MSAGHSAVAEHTSEVQSWIDALVDDGFDDLGDHPSSDGTQQNTVA